MLLVTERFTALAQVVRIGKGMPNQPSLYIPDNPEFYAEAELAATIEGLIDDLVDLVVPSARGVRQPALVR